MSTSKTEAKVLQLPVSTASGKPNRSFTKRWKHADLFVNGFTVVPVLFLQQYAHLKPEISPSEAMFILHLMEFKWDENHPYPGYKTLARRMGRSEKAVQKMAQSLEIKKYLYRQIRKADTNKFDLTPLFDVLLAKAEESKAGNVKRSKQT